MFGVYNSYLPEIKMKEDKRMISMDKLKQQKEIYDRGQLLNSIDKIVNPGKFY
ncbi:MAG: hypothetical protein PF450_12120 [Bacteroidales bacterium]|jgi:3-methyladenine DNA glycosylase AlkC|nr:hypothetical protein [Bacteroidales bacterium]